MAFEDISEALTGFDFDNVVVLDTETTGLESYNGDEILSISICDAYGNIQFDSLVKPKKKRSWPEAEKINGISPAMVKNSPTIDEIADDIRRFICTGKLVVGYNISFDIDFLVSSDVLPSYPRTFDVMMEYAKVHGSKSSPFGGRYCYSKLETCANGYGYSFAAHASKEDAVATAYCYRSLINDESYISEILPDLKARLTEYHMSQTKVTTQNIFDFIEKGIMSSSDAFLKIGAVTRGKTKGTKRYECFIEDKCIGIGQPSDVERIADLLFTDEDSLPDQIKCSIVLSSDGSSTHCKCTITQGTRNLAKQLKNMAREYRERNDCEWHQVEKPCAKEKRGPVILPEAATTSEKTQEKSCAKENKPMKLAAVLIFVLIEIVIMLINAPLAIAIAIAAIIVGRKIKRS